MVFLGVDLNQNESTVLLAKILPWKEVPWTDPLYISLQFFSHSVDMNVGSDNFR
jgi:hypothetical protein